MINIKKLKNYTLLLNIIKNPSLFIKKTEYIFILSHTRSYSTLLSHILANNRDICGYTEMHISYKTSINFQILKIFAMEQYKSDIQKKFLLDKILHNHLEISEEVLRNKSLSIIFLLRNPNDTLKSIMNYTLRRKGYVNADKASDYYIKRLLKLKEYSLNSKGKNIFIKSESIINKTEETFDLLADYLNLEEKLSPDYNTFEFTGKSKLGDGSKYIKSGKIQKNITHTDMEISDEISLKCDKAYNECCEVLKENSIKFI